MNPPPSRRPTVATAPQRRRLGVDDQGQYTYKKVHTCIYLHGSVHVLVLGVRSPQYTRNA